MSSMVKIVGNFDVRKFFSLVCVLDLILDESIIAGSVGGGINTGKILIGCVGARCGTIIIYGLLFARREVSEKEQPIK